MKKLLFASSFFASVILALAARADDTQILRTLSGDVPAGVRTIQADNQHGNVTVTAVGEDFRWEWTLRSSGTRSTRAENYAQECRLDVRQIDGGLQLVVVRPDMRQGDITRSNGPMRHFLSLVTLGVVSSHEDQVHSDLILRVPAASMIDVRNRFGKVNVSGARAATTVDCEHGGVNLSNIDATVTARTSFASLRAEKIGPAQLTNQNGNVEVRDVAGHLQAATSFATLKVRDVKGDARLKNQNGAIEAVGITGDLTAATSFAHLHAEKIGGKADLKAQNARLEATGISGNVTAATSFGSLHVRDSGGHVVLKNQNGTIDAIRVTGDLIAETSFADLRVEEIGGRADLDCRNGKIEATRVTGNVQATNSFAPMRVRDIGGAADLKGQNGEVAAAGVTGDIRAQTSFARMRLEGNSRRFEARNQNGSVEIVATSPGVQQIDASASFAPIDVRLPGESKPLIRAATSFGKVKSDFPVLQGDTVSEARFAADAAPLKISLRGQNGDIRIQQIAAR
jgi:DUF4097 and DUF4098 domain-containing protein YvlB